MIEGADNQDARERMNVRGREDISTPGKRGRESWAQWGVGKGEEVREEKKRTSQVKVEQKNCPSQGYGPWDRRHWGMVILPEEPKEPKETKGLDQSLPTGPCVLLSRYNLSGL